MQFKLASITLMALSLQAVADSDSVAQPVRVDDSSLCFSVKAFGALGDGVHDDTAAFQQAAAAADTAGGGCVRVPSAAHGAGFVLTKTVTLAPGVKLLGDVGGFPEVPHAFGPPGDLNTTGGSRILARITAPGAPLFTITQGCGVKGLMIFYDRMPSPSDEQFRDPDSVYYYPSFEAARAGFRKDHVPAIGPTIYVTNGVRVHIEFVIASGFVDGIYFAQGGGQSSVSNVQGYGFGALVTVEQAADVFSFRNIRYSVNAGPNPLGQEPPQQACEVQHPRPRVCQGNFTILPAIVALDSSNVGIWLGRADGYMANELFFFGVNTGIRLGFAPGNRTELRNPVTGQLAGDPSSPGSLGPAQGPWGSISGLMVDQCQLGIHFVWPNPLTNRFTNIQLHPSFWAGQTLQLQATPSSPCKSCPGAGNNLAKVGDEAAIFFDKTHTVDTDRRIIPTTLISNCVIASFNDSTNFGHAGAMLGQSNGRAFLFEGDGGLVEVSGLAMSNEQDAYTNLWAAAQGSITSMRVSHAVLNYSMVDDFMIRLDGNEQ